MHSEFSKMVGAALGVAIQQVATSAATEIDAQRLIEKNIQPEVDDCPFPEDGDVCTDACFAIAAAFRGQGVECHPKEFAAVVVDAFAAQYGDAFTVAIGGDGFLNAHITEAFAGKLIESFWQSQGELLLTIEPSIDWRHVEQFAASSNNEDIVQLLAAGPLSVERRLELLALLGDVELEVAPYLSGLECMQNIPWLLEHFAAVVQRERYREFLESTPMPAISKTDDATVMLLGFRRHALTPLYRGHPERSFTYAVRCLRYCIGQYNRPEFRAVAILGKPEEERRQTLGALPLLAIVVDGYCKRLVAACGS